MKMANERGGGRERHMTSQKIYYISASATICIKEQTLALRAKNSVVQSHRLSETNAIHPSGFIVPRRNRKDSSVWAGPILLQLPQNQNNPSIDDLNLLDSDD